MKQHFTVLCQSQHHQNSLVQPLLMRSYSCDSGSASQSGGQVSQPFYFICRWVYGMFNALQSCTRTQAFIKQDKVSIPGRRMCFTGIQVTPRCYTPVDLVGCILTGSHSHHHAPERETTCSSAVETLVPQLLFSIISVYSIIISGIAFS